MKLNDLVNDFLGRLKGRLGEVARPNGTFFAANVATTALQRIRLDALRGTPMTEEGQRFVTGAAAYLASLAAGNWNRRGLAVRGSAKLDGPPSDAQLSISASRTRDGNAEGYRQDFLRDAFELLIKPPQYFPYLHGQVYALSSLVYPSPEYLYMYGTYLLQSPRAQGNWPKAEKVGGLEEDFHAAPECPDAHLNLGTRLKWRGRREEAMSVFEDAVRRWPRNRQAVDSCMWLLTDTMVEAPAARR